VEELVRRKVLALLPVVLVEVLVRLGRNKGSFLLPKLVGNVLDLVKLLKIHVRLARAKVELKIEKLYQ
jgi:hypothetical protein